MARTIKYKYGLPHMAIDMQLFYQIALMFLYIILFLTFGVRCMYKSVNIRHKYVSKCNVQLSPLIYIPSSRKVFEVRRMK